MRLPNPFMFRDASCRTDRRSSRRFFVLLPLGGSMSGASAEGTWGIGGVMFPRASVPLPFQSVVRSISCVLPIPVRFSTVSLRARASRAPPTGPGRESPVPSLLPVSMFRYDVEKFVVALSIRAQPLT